MTGKADSIPLSISSQEKIPAYAMMAYLFVFLLVTILAKALFALVSRDLVAFTFFSTGHNVSSFDVKQSISLVFALICKQTGFILCANCVVGLGQQATGYWVFWIEFVAALQPFQSTFVLARLES